MNIPDFDENDDLDYGFTTEDIAELDELRRRHLSGESKSYIWEEAKAIITRKSRLKQL